MGSVGRTAGRPANDREDFLYCLIAWSGKPHIVLPSGNVANLAGQHFPQDTERYNGHAFDTLQFQQCLVTGHKNI
jgi:hypothetical protein